MGCRLTPRRPEPLSDTHDLVGFESGTASLDDWLRRRARPNQVSGASRTFVLVDEAGAVIGYYVLASGAITITEATGKFRRNMPDPIPAVVLARLAIARNQQGKGLGRALTMDCFQRVISAADQVGVRGLVVHAISEEAAAFYRKLGFSASLTSPATLMITLAELRDSIA